MAQIAPTRHESWLTLFSNREVVICQVLPFEKLRYNVVQRHSLFQVRMHHCFDIPRVSHSLRSLCLDIAVYEKDELGGTNEAQRTTKKS